MKTPLIRVTEVREHDLVQTQYGTWEPVTSVVSIPQDKVVYLMFEGHTEPRHPSDRVRVARIS